LKILQLTKFYPPFWGGIESVTYELTEGLHAAGYECVVLCANTTNVTVDEVFENKYKVIRAASYGRVFSTSISPALINIFRKIANDFDIIHVHFPDPLTALALSLVKPKAKVVIHWHSDIIKQSYLLKFYLPLQNMVLKRADLIIGTSPKYIQESPQLKDFVYKTVAIPLGSEVKVFENTTAVEASILNRFKGKKILFSLGRLVYYKGYNYLIEAASLISNDFVIVIGGEGPEYSNLKKQIASYKLEAKVHLIGKIPQVELASWFKACNIFCFPSTFASEAFGVSQIEAMSFGKPVIATEIPRSGVSWVNAHGVSGVNVKLGSATELANAIQLLANDVNLYQKYSVGAKHRYEAMFKPNQMVDSMLNQYLKLTRQGESNLSQLSKLPKVSIITVLLDNKKYIRDVIDSVLSQDYENIEYLIIDGDSKDGSVEIIESYKDKIHVFISEKDEGVYDALNKGILKASGDIIGLLHSDDFFDHPRVISSIVEKFLKDKVDAVYGDLRYIGNTGKNEIVRVWKAGAYKPNFFYKGWMPPHPTFYVRREVYQKFGAFNTQLKFAADYELMLRFILKHQITLSYIPEFLVKMRVGGASNRNLSNRIKANIEDRKAWKLVEIKPGFLTLVLKPLKKIFQYSIFNQSWKTPQ
jgi:glycosyltransferase involved in cell wall biosynthesis